MAEHPRRIGAAWKLFEASIVNPAAGPVQRREMQRAFFAGAWWAIQLLDGITEPAVPEQEAVEIVSRVMADCRTFAAREAEGGPDG